MAEYDPTIGDGKGTGGAGERAEADISKGALSDKKAVTARAYGFTD